MAFFLARAPLLQPPLSILSTASSLSVYQRLRVWMVGTKFPGCWTPFHVINTQYFHKPAFRKKHHGFPVEDEQNHRYRAVFPVVRFRWLLFLQWLSYRSSAFVCEFPMAAFPTMAMVAFPAVAELPVVRFRL
ncbi:hypothetical protein R6Q59_035729 [Mikania micrantha]